ncbi:MAG: MFS transporter [Actinomycetota bacterium]
MDLPFRSEFSPGPDGGSEGLATPILPLLAGYWSFGQYWGVWVILVFEFQKAHHISDPHLGLLYTLLSATAVIVMLVIAPRMQHLSLSTNVPLSLVSLGIGTLAITYLPNAYTFVGFAAVGVGNGLIDIYGNVAAQQAEVKSRRPVLQWLHAAYALGGVTGAGVAGLVRVGGLDYRLGLAFAGVTLFATSWWTARTFSPEAGRANQGRAAFSITALFRSPVLWIPAIVVLFAFLIEGSMDTWSGLYLREQLRAGAGTAALAFIAFSASMFFGRLFASKALFGLGARRTILVAGVGSAVGGTIATLTSSPVIVGFAFLLLGFTLAAAAPAGYGLVEASEENAASAIAAVTTVGYTGFIWSPPLLGWVAQTFNLRATMTVIVIATIGVIGAGLLAPRKLAKD